VEDVALTIKCLHALQLKHRPPHIFR
jgi:hypothetical protein